MTSLTRRDVVVALAAAYPSLVLFPGCKRSTVSTLRAEESTPNNVTALIDERLAQELTAEQFVAVIAASPNITRRAPNMVQLYRDGLASASALTFFNDGRRKALQRLRQADLDPTIKMIMLDLQLENVDHSVAMCMDHFVGVFELLRRWGHPDEIAWTGLFHAIYGTEANVVNMLDHRAEQDRARVRAVVGERTERWVALFGLMEACDFVAETREAGGPASRLTFFEAASSIGNTISEEDFRVLAELQVANAYEPFVDSGRGNELGIARKFLDLEPYLSSGGQAALARVVQEFPNSANEEVGCGPVTRRGTGTGIGTDSDSDRPNDEDGESMPG